MKIVNSRSLARTVDAVNEAFFYARELTKSQREEAAKWIAGRQGLPGSYLNMFALTKKDIEDGVRVFTGEKIAPGAAARHIIGEEACRALILLDSRSRNVSDALDRAAVGMLDRLHGADKSAGRKVGTYCCGRCSVSFWRHLVVGGFDHAERRLEAGVKELVKYRKDDGKWRTFPFYYTLLALSEIDLPVAVREMRYAAPVIERLLQRAPRDDKTARRRRLLMERILAKC
jgi:hypothetical protein